MAEEMTDNEALQEILKFKNVFRAAEKLEAALTTVTNLKGQVAALKKEVKEAEAERLAAVEARDKAKALLEQLDQRVKQAQDAFDDQIKARREQAEKDILAVKNETRAKMDKIRADHEEDVKRYFDGLKEKAAKL